MDILPIWAKMRKIEFMNSLPEGVEIADSVETPSVCLSSAIVSMTENTSVSWAKSGEFGTINYNEDGSVSFNSEPSDPECYGQNLNNGCGWYLTPSEAATDISEYNYVAVRVKSDAVVDLTTWSANSLPDSIYARKVMYEPGAVLENQDGTKTLVWRATTAFSNIKKAKAIGILVQSGTEEDGKQGNFIPRDVQIYEIYFSKLMPEAEVTPATPGIETESTEEIEALN